MIKLSDKIADLKKVRKLFVIADAAHLDMISDFDPDHDVIVAGDPMVLEGAEDQGRIAVPFDTGLMFADLGDVIKKSGEQRLRGSDWFFDGNTDLTIFNGVSLGRQFLIKSQVALSIHNHICAVIVGWKSRFAPDAIIVYGLDCSFPGNSRIDQIASLSNAAAAQGIALENRAHRAADVPLKTRNSLRQSLIRSVYSSILRVICTVSRLFRRTAHERKPKVLLLCTHLNALPLLERMDDLPCRPVLIGERFPNQRNLMWVSRCIKKGAETVFLRTPSLTPGEHEELERIRRALHHYWDSGRSKVPQEMINFARDAIVDDESFVQAARLTKTAEYLLEDGNVDFILTDSLSNSLYNAVLQLAKERDIPVAATWHAPMLLDVLSFTLGSDPRSSFLVDVMFTWGSAQEVWLKRIGASSAPQQTGTMLMPRPKAISPVMSTRENVLLLEYAVPNTEVTYRPSLSTRYFIEFGSMLNQAGYKVRFKLHPSNDTVDRYKAIAERYGIDCEIVRGGLFSEHVAWSDIVIGPGHSGAMLETLMAGRPYYPVLYEPHGIWPGYFADLKVYHNVDALQQELQCDYAFPDEFLEMWTSSKTITDPVMETARAINKVIECHRT